MFVLENGFGEEQFLSRTTSVRLHLRTRKKKIGFCFLLCALCLTGRWTGLFLLQITTRRIIEAQDKEAHRGFEAL